MKKIENASMAKYTSFKVGGPAREMLIVENKEELKEVLSLMASKNEKYVFIGNGTNIIFTDEGYEGTVIRAGEGLSFVEYDEDRITAGCGALMSKIARKAYSEELTGFEFAAGIPGSIGGAMFMNAGAYGGEMKDVVEKVTLISRDGKHMRTVSGEEMEFGYRTGILQKTGEIAVEVTLKLKKGEKKKIGEKMTEFNSKRNAKQPVNFPSAGSSFKRPEGYFAGKLIEDAGLKGVSVGGAQVSEKHCGFIINRGGATAGDIINLMKLVQDRVFEKFGVRLEPEVRIID